MTIKTSLASLFRLRALLCLLALAAVSLESPSAAAAAKAKIIAKISTNRTRAARSTFTIPTKVKKIGVTDSLTLHLGSYTFEISGTSFKRSVKSNIYKYSTKAGSLGLVSAILDGKARTFSFVVKGVPVIDQRYPMRLEVAVGAVRNCDLIGGQGKGSVTRKSLLLSRLGRCPDNSEILTSSVGLLTLGVSAETIFRLDAKSAVSKLAVYAADSSGGSAAKVCDMSDKGDPSTGDIIAGDNSYACKVSFTPTIVGKKYYVARGQRGGKITFPGLSLQTINQLTESDAQSALSIQTSALNLWSSVRSSLGASAAARIEVIQKILELPGVLSAGLSTNGIDIVITMKSGLEVVIVLNTKSLSSASTLPSSFAAQPLASDQALLRSAAIKPRSGAGPLRILLYDPGFFPGFENETLEAFAAAADPGEVQITTIKNDAAKDVRSLDVITNFDFVVLTTHGSIDAKGRVGFVVPLKNEAQIAEYLPLIQAGKVVLSGTENIGPGISHSGVLVMPDYFLGLPGTFQNSTIIGSSCYSAANGSMASALLAKGAAAYLGYDEVVFSDFAADKASEFFCSTLIEKKSVGEAYSALSPKTDDSPFIKSDGDQTFASIRFSGSPGSNLTQSASFDEFKIFLEPPRHLLFHGESLTSAISIGGHKLPPCLKFKLRNNSTNLISIFRKTESGQFFSVNDELFADGDLKFTAGTVNGVADISTYLVREDSGAIIGQRKPTIEVLCAKPTVGVLVPDSGTVQIGQEAVFNLSELQATGCDLRLSISILTQSETGEVITNEGGCGTLLNQAATPLEEVGGWSIPASQLPLRLSTAGCINTRKISVIYNQYILGQTAPQFDDARFLNELPLVSSVLLKKDFDIQSGNFETKFILYTRDVAPFGTLNRFYVSTLPFINPPAPGQVARYCLKVNTHGIPGPDNQQAGVPNPPDHEYLVVSEDVCERLSESPGFYTPTPAECAGWLGGKMALYAFGVGNNFGLSSSVLAGESPGCVDRCTPAQATDYYAPLRSWTYTARRLTSSQFNCSSP